MPLGGGFKRRKSHPNTRGRGRGRGGRGEQRFTMDGRRDATSTFDYPSSDGVAPQEPEFVEYNVQPLATRMLPQSASPVVNKVNPNSRTSSTTMSQMTKSRFMDLPLSTPTQRAISEVLGYETMTKVQHFAIPPGLAGDFATSSHSRLQKDASDPSR